MLKSYVESMIDGQIKQYENDSKSAVRYESLEDKETAMRYKQSALSDLATIQKLTNSALGQKGVL